MKKVFADTSGWLAVVVKSDALHEKAVEIYLRLLASNRNFVVHEAILLEIGNSLSNAKARNIAFRLKRKYRKFKSYRTDCTVARTLRSRLETLCRTKR
ncbi:MAG: hypothetical protein LH472_12610 [Pyrinomonadaceae bacterium]|nr:hypothetical protein [Pyrinomonadaceae bacterium]